nr:hypothetical protein [Pseudomonas sp. BF-R-30]
MVANDNAASLAPRGALRFIASRLAPTGGMRCSILFGRHKKTGLGDPLESWPDVRARPEMRSTVGASLLAMVANDNAASLTPRGVLRFIASRLAPTRGMRCSILFGRHKKTGLGDPLESWPDVHARPEKRSTVGASLLAMVANDNAASLAPRGVLRFIASRLAPTGGMRCSCV